MTAVFADTHYFLALVNRRDEAHVKAFRFGNDFRGTVLTTDWILTEVGDALSRPTKRPIFLELLLHLQGNAKFVIVEATHESFSRGVELFQSRPDKHWSLTDCISFVVMKDYSILEALTADHHFEQAGYTALLV